MKAKIAKKYKSLHEVCSNYPKIQLSTGKGVRIINFDPEIIADKITENGFIEQFCLSEEERTQVREVREKNKQLIKK